MSHRMSDRVAELTSARVPFVHATVVRAQEPTSARAGRRRDRSWPTARSRASSAASAPRSRCASPRWTRCATASPLLLRVLPDGDDARSPSRRARGSWSTRACPAARWRSSCEPMLPPPLVAVVGSTPIADAPGRCWPARWASSAVGTRPAHVPPGATAVVIGHPRARRGRVDPGRARRRGRLRRAGRQPDGGARRCWPRLEPHRRRSGHGCTPRSGWTSAPRTAAGDRAVDPGRDRPGRTPRRG